MVTGTEYYRRKRRMKKGELAVRCGMTPLALKNILQGKKTKSSLAYYYVRLADVLSVTVDELLEEYDESTLEDGDHGAYPCRTENPDNCITVYRHVKGLTLEQLGKRMGKCKERARQACLTKFPKEKHIQTLAAYEGITPEEFRAQYQPDHRDDK